MPLKLLLLVCVFATCALGAEAPVLRSLETAGVELLRNGGFQEGEGNRALAWDAYEQGGYRREPGAGRGGSEGLFCENAEPAGRSGAVQRIELKRTRPAPLHVTGWSRAEGVTGSPDGNYSLYVDLVYTDGTPLWGRVAPFPTGTHDWVQREVLVVPEKPVASVSIYCLFRGHRGRAWFDDVSVRELDPGAGGTLFDGMPVTRGTLPGPTKGMQRTIQSGELTVVWQDHGPLSDVRLGARSLKVAGAPSGFLARDVAAGSAVYPFVDGKCEALGLSLKAGMSNPGAVVFTGEVKDETGKDRAITLFFAIPFPRAEGRWHDDGRRARPLVSGEYTNAAAVGSGSTGTMSRHPWACVTGPAGGLALGIDMTRPAQYRLFYNADLQALVLAYDLALVKETKRFPSAAPFQFVLFAADPKWGFRSAAERYQRIFMPLYLVRSEEQGIWMPFTDVSTVQGWQDFGFRYHEGNNNVAFDDANGILSFPYTEPSTYWMKMPKEMPRTPEAAVAELKRLREQGSAGEKRWAAAAEHAAIYGPDGQPQMRFLDTPWCDGAVWSLCPLPDVAGEPNAATLHWNAEVREARYGSKAKGQIDGEYLDSLEAYVTADLNFRREHFAAVNTPLTFDTATRRPAIHKAFAIAEYVRFVADDVHRAGKLMFANSVPYRFAFLTAHLDVMGTETDWLRGGEYRPADDATMLQWRTLSGAKPYLLLMNTDYEKLVPALVERYFQRSLFYGIYPSMFSHNASENPYWRNPAWYNRDRELFKRYIPVIRTVAQAGWQPVTHARCEGAWVERFGPGAEGASYFTLLNPGDKPVEAELRLEPEAPAGKRLVDLVTGDSFALANGAARIPLAADGARALRVER